MMRIVVLTMSVCLGGASGQSGPAQITLQELTVPAERLPAGCVMSRDTAALGVLEAPWIGTDPPVIARIRERADPPPPLPDAPLTTREHARFRLGLAEGIEEGYVAVYTQDAATTGSRALLHVYGLRYSDPSKAATVGTRWLRNPHASRTVIGPVLAIVHGDGGECFRIITEHLQRLARK